MNLPILDISDTQNFIANDLLWTFPFRQLDVLKIPVCPIYPCLIPLYRWMIFHYMGIPYVAYSGARGYLSSFPPLTTMIHASRIMRLQFQCECMHKGISCCWWVWYASQLSAFSCAYNHLKKHQILAPFSWGCRASLLGYRDILLRYVRGGTTFMRRKKKHCANISCQCYFFFILSVVSLEAYYSRE